MGAGPVCGRLAFPCLKFASFIDPDLPLSKANSVEVQKCIGMLVQWYIGIVVYALFSMFVVSYVSTIVCQGLPKRHTLHGSSGQ